MKHYNYVIGWYSPRTSHFNWIDGTSIRHFGSAKEYVDHILAGQTAYVRENVVFLECYNETKDARDTWLHVTFGHPQPALESHAEMVAHPDYSNPCYFSMSILDASESSNIALVKVAPYKAILANIENGIVNYEYGLNYELGLYHTYSSTEYKGLTVSKDMVLAYYTPTYLFD
jgi:hypothetical protein